MPKLDATDLYVLSDALHMELTITSDDTIDGNVTMPIDCVEVGLRYQMALNIESSRVEWENGKPNRIGLLLKGEGDFGLCVLHDLKLAQVHVGVLNTANIKAVGKAKRSLRLTNFMEDRRKTPMAELYWSDLHDAKVYSYHRGEYAKDWTSGSGLLDKAKSAA